MKISFQKEDFLNSLNIVTRALKKGNLYQILDCVLIDASKNKISLICQDGKEITIVKEAEGNIIEKGKAAIDGGRLLDIIRSMDDNTDIELEVKENKECIVSWGQDKNIKIQAKDETTYPNITNINKDNKVVINELKLKNILEKTIFCYDRNADTGNVVLRGIYFNVKKDRILAKSMDGYIISVINDSLMSDFDKYETIIPGSALEEMNKLLKGEINKDVNIYFNDKNVTFEFSDTLFTAITIQNSYIDTDRIFSVEYSTKINIKRMSLIKALNRAITIIKNNDNRPIIFDIKDDLLNVNISTLDGEAHEDIEIKKTGKELTIAFNAYNLIKILNTISDENIDMYFSGAKQPVIIKDKQENYSYLATPVSI